MEDINLNFLLTLLVALGGVVGAWAVAKFQIGVHGRELKNLSGKIGMLYDRSDENRQNIALLHANVTPIQAILDPQEINRFNRDRGEFEAKTNIRLDHVERHMEQMSDRFYSHLLRGDKPHHECPEE